MATTFAQVFKLRADSKSLDFVNLDLSGDLNLYVDPLQLYRSPKPDMHAAHSLIVEFFSRAIDFVKTGRPEKAESMCHFPDAENLLGIATSMSGHGPHRLLGNKIYEELVRNPEIQEHGLHFLSEFHLLIEGISFDLISDAAVQISKSVFVSYTQQQCRLHGVPLQRVKLHHVFQWEDVEWDSIDCELPVNPLRNDEPFLLTPMSVVRRYPEGDYTEYYNEIYRHVLLERERSRLWSGLGKQPRITFKEIAERYNIGKPEVVEHVKAEPANRTEFYAKIRPVPVTAWLEAEAANRGVNINKVVTIDALHILDQSLHAANKDEIDRKVYASVSHQQELSRNPRKLTDEINDLAKRCKEEFVLLLGNYRDGMRRLQEIQAILNRRYTVITPKMLEGLPGSSLGDTVVCLSALARFTVIEDSYPGGQLYEVAKLCNNGVIAALLREAGKQSSFMSVGVSREHSNFHEVSYELIKGNGIDQKYVDDAVRWAEERYSANMRFWDEQYPWRNTEG